MKIAFITSEALPYAKTGGLADVSGALPKALEELGCSVKIFMPKYYVIEESKYDLHYNWEIGEIKIKIGSNTRFVHIYQSMLPDSNVEVNFIDCPHYFHRDQIYTDGFDEDERFILFSKAVLETLIRLNWTPDVLHCNDWPTGLLPLFLKENYVKGEFFSKTASIFSIHNIGYQGIFNKDAVKKADINPELFYPMSPIEYYNGISFLKAAISYSDIINTVSKTYAKEILTPEYGAGLDGVLREREKDLYGILNGVDYSLWDPENDKLLPYDFSLNNLDGKLDNKEYLLNKIKLKYSHEVPLIGIVSRLVSQKGFDLFEQVSDELMLLNVQWIILGSGENKYEEMFRDLQQNYPEKVSAYIGFNNEMSHLIEAGADMLLMSSLYEPCGLNQIYSLRYGTVPIVRRTGGLADTVKDYDESIASGELNGNGFVFDEYTGDALLSAVSRAIDYFKDKENWNKIISTGMQQLFSWKDAAREYLTLYNLAVDKKFE